MAIHSESKATISHRRLWAGIPRARDQEEDQEAVGEEPEKKTTVERKGVDRYQEGGPKGWKRFVCGLYPAPG